MRSLIPRTWGKRLLAIWFAIFILNLLFAIAIGAFRDSEMTPKRSYDFGDPAAACANLKNKLVQDSSTTQIQRDSNYQSTIRAARNDEALADAFIDYPELLIPRLNDSQWNEHAMRMSNAFWSSARIAGLDTDLGVILENAGETWNKRRISYNTPPGPLKGELLDEQINLDRRLSRDTKKIRTQCNLSPQLLP